MSSVDVYSNIPIETINKKYNIILADPPWSYHLYRPQYSRKNNSNMTIKTAARFYNTMTTDEICSLPINQISDKNCALFLWVTSPLLEDGLQVIRAWKFNYKTIAFVWIKTYPHSEKLRLGLGHYTRPSTEICLLAMRGILPRKSKTVYQAIISSISRHSEKPIQVHDRIVQLFGDLPRIELFARKSYSGYDSWGDQLSVIDCINPG
jgi:site-specific DNA-methyltransferase (adenine-specific)